MLEVLIGAVAVIVAAVVGAILTARYTHRSQMRLLEKQMELQRELHEHLLEQQQQFTRALESERRHHERFQQFVRDSRERSGGA